MLNQSLSSPFGRHVSVRTVLLALFSLVALIMPSAQAQTFTVLHQFAGGLDGQDPLDGSLILDSKGNLYGATVLGGSGACDGGCGTIFKVTPAGHETVLYSFTGTNGDGKYPYGSLVRDSAGNFYGTTYGGGTSGAGCNGYGCGTVFKLTPGGNETVLYSFTGGVDGANPQAGLIRDSAGNLYGTTYLGGANNWGTLFKVDGSGNETVLHNFDGSTGDGGDVVGGLIEDSSGNLYGTTEGGGNSGCDPSVNIGCGTVYELATDGTEAVLHRFSYSGTGGQWLGEERLLRDTAGNIYGTSQAGHSGRGWGTVFKLDSAGNFTVLHSFSGGAGGGNPWAGVISDPAGNLYGTTPEGGSGTCLGFGCGTVYKLGANGKFTVLHQFSGQSGDGGVPWAALVRDRAGNFYGTTEIGGLGDGIVFKITP
jgi:uncharacterized repeat protein (TIGR03803 family)